jgi:hypothetical protein
MLWPVFLLMLVVDGFVASILMRNLQNQILAVIFQLARPFLIGIAWSCGSLGIVSVLMDDSLDN